jgi:hypothetical protein
MIMSEYGVPLVECMHWTREQLMLFKRKIENRKKEEYKMQAKLNGGQLDTKDGLDTDGAVPIETLIDNGTLPVKKKTL